MLEIRGANAGDIDGAIAALVDAFADDPLMLYLFQESRAGVRAGIAGFFTTLLKVRIALAMPALVLEQDGVIRGAAMGYDTSRPSWPETLSAEFRAFKAATQGFEPRLAAYAAIADACEPQEAHHYLGVIGVHPSLQGKGAGKILLDAFCAPSTSDPKSHGVFLETTNPSSLAFYYRNGFELRGEGDLDGTHVWCVFKPR